MGNNNLKLLSRAQIFKNQVQEYDGEKIVLRDNDQNCIPKFLYFHDEIKENCYKIFQKYITLDNDADVYVFYYDSKIFAIRSNPKTSIYYCKNVTLGPIDKLLLFNIENAI